MRRFLTWLVTSSSCWHRWDKKLEHDMPFGTQRRCTECGAAEMVFADDSGWCGAYWGKVSPASESKAP